MEIRLRDASASDLEDVRRALRLAGLPVEGVDSQMKDFFICDGDGVFRGAAGLEIHGSDGLLRSLVVQPGMRRRGIGRRLCQRIFDHAASLGCGAVYLLTLDAAAYFERQGFQVIERNQAPPGIRESEEFSALCPASAVLMRRIVKT